MKYRLAFIIYLLLMLCCPAWADATAVWSTNAALPGEKVLLFILRENRSTANPTLIKNVDHGRVVNGSYQGQANDNVALQDAAGNSIGNLEVCAICIETGRSGTVECNQVEITYSTGQKEIVKVPPLTVYSTAKVEWRTVESDGGSNNDSEQPTTFGTFWMTGPDEFYTGQCVKASLKLLLPQSFVSLTQLPQVVASHVKAEQFHYQANGALAKMMEQWLPLRNRTVQARGQKWYVLDLETTLVPLPAANNVHADYDVYVSIPCAFRETHTITSKQTPGFSFSSTTVQNINKTLKLPKLALPKPRPLPPNPPADFTDLVGQFSVTATTTAKDLSMNEMIEVEITVQGKGAMELLTCPQVQDGEQWKLMSPTRNIIYAPTGEVTAVVFSQMMRPVAEVSAVPSFSFSYFNAEEQEYKTAASAPIALPWRQTEASGSGQMVDGGAAPPPAGTVPVAELTDIYHFMPNTAAGGKSVSIDLPRELWYLLYLPGLGIFIWLLARHIKQKWQLKSAARQQERTLQALAAEQNAMAFLKGIGAFIESNIPTAKNNPQLQAILEKRDAEVFRPDAAPHVTEEEKAGMLRSVRKALSGLVLVAMMLCGLSCATAQAQEDAAMSAYNARQYSKAQQLLEQELQQEEPTRNKADTLYNIGNCCYKLDKPGQAALYYARALHEEPGFAEAEANLGFIQRKEGAILPHKTTTEKVFTYLSMPQLWLATVVCTAGLLLCIALIVWLGKRYSAATRTGTGIFLVLSLLCLADHIYYATRSMPELTATPPADIAYITTATTARTAAEENAGTVTELPPSTPVQLLSVRGSWSYVETFTGVRGWIPTADVTPLLEGERDATPALILSFQ